MNTLLKTTTLCAALGARAFAAPRPTPSAPAHPLEPSVPLELEGLGDLRDGLCAGAAERLLHQGRQPRGDALREPPQDLLPGRPAAAEPLFAALHVTPPGVEHGHGQRRLGQEEAELLLSLAGTHSVVVVEHDMDFVRSIARRVTVLHEGRVLAEGSMDQVQNDQRVIDVYLGA